MLENGGLLVRNAAVPLKMGFEMTVCSGHFFGGFLNRVFHFCKQQFFGGVNQNTQFSHRGAILYFLPCVPQTQATPLHAAYSMSLAEEILRWEDWPPVTLMMCMSHRSPLYKSSKLTHLDHRELWENNWCLLRIPCWLTRNMVWFAHSFISIHM